MNMNLVKTRFLFIEISFIIIKRKVTKMNNLEVINEKVFEDIKHVDENGYEYWYARELMSILNYKRWDKFMNVIVKARIL